jgi:hypothetical protein
MRPTGPSEEAPCNRAEKRKEWRASVESGKVGKFLSYCHEGKGGVWAVVVVSVSLDDPGGEAPGCGSAVQYKLVYQHDPRKTDGAIMSSERSEIAWANERASFAVESVFDYDNDGRDEIILSESRWANGGGGDGPSLLVLTAKGDKIAAYPPAHDATAVMDVDGDGRPDLIDGAFFEGECDGGLDRRKERGVPLLYHSLPNGTFSASDEIARRWAVTKCPTMPNATPLDAVSATCQRLWGRSPDAILKDASSLPLPHYDLCNEPPDALRVAPLLKAAIPFKTLNIDTPVPFPARLP